MDFDSKVLAENVRLCRAKKGITQTKLSKTVKTSVPTINAIEHSKRIPKVDLLCKIAEVFEVTVDYLLEKH